ncbi:MAG TPA: ATP-binding protein [Polyangiaceae bacterium]|nr:ATP-binding protein [Polyangiaceae bacterium]
MSSDTRRENADLLHSQLLDTAPDAMVVVGPDGTICFVNVQTENLFGYARDELLGRRLEFLIPERFRGTHGEHIERFFANPTSRPMGSGLELFGRRKGGAELPIEVSLSPLQSERGMTVSASIRDISERKRLEAAVKSEDERRAAELREARLAAEAASAAKSEFLSSMSHELRTPLNAILGFAQLLARDTREPLSARHKQRVEHILKGGEHLLRLINDILDLSRIEAGGVAISTEAVSVADVLAEVERTLQPLAARQNVQVEMAPLPDGLPMVSADRTRFVQIVMNLGSNAVKYNRAFGMVRFDVSVPDAERVRISVQDTGIGIPLDKQATIFQPFQRAGQETGPIEGTGIGLVITKRLASLMHGDVEFESKPGVGSRFWVTLPTHTEHSPSSRTLPRGLDADDRLVREGHRLVLYVEDNPANALFMQDLLSTFDSIDLLVAPNAEAGVEIAERRRPAVVIMDINLPGMNGLDALRALRAKEQTRDIPVIALTAAASERDRQAGERAGFYRYLTKPIQVDELLAALETLIE